MGFISDCSITAQPPWIWRVPAYLKWLFPLLPVEIILMKKDKFLFYAWRSKREGIDIISFGFLTYKVTPSWLGLDVAPEISGSPWCPSFEEGNLVLLKWARKGHRHLVTQRTRSGLPGDRLRWPRHYGNSVSMLVRQEGSRWVQIWR